MACRSRIGISTGRPLDDGLLWRSSIELNTDFEKPAFQRSRAQTWCKSVLRSVAASPDVTPS